MGNFDFKILFPFKHFIRRFFSINLSQLREAQEVAPLIYISSKDIECDAKCLQAFDNAFFFTVMIEISKKSSLFLVNDASHLLVLWAKQFICRSADFSEI
mgnify:CR=1 FL=1